MKNRDCDKRAHTRKIYDSFQVKDEISRLNKVPIFYLLKEKVWIFTTPSNMFILQNRAINVNEILSQMFLECIQDSTLQLNTDQKIVIFSLRTKYKFLYATDFRGRKLIKEEESLACLVLSLGVSKRGFLSKRLMIAMRTEVKMAFRIQMLHCKKVGNANMKFIVTMTTLTIKTEQYESYSELMITTLVTWHALIGLQEVPTAPREPWKNYQNFENQIRLKDMIRKFDFEVVTS